MGIYWFMKTTSKGPITIDELDEMELRLSSGNDIPIDRVSVPAEEYRRLLIAYRWCYLSMKMYENTMDIPRRLEQIRSLHKNEV